MDRRTFLGQTAAAVGSLIVGGTTAGQIPATRPSTPASRPARLKVSDVVTLGRSGVKASRLAIGTGTEAGGEQRRLGIDGLVRLFRYGLDHGIRWWETADMYKTHPHVGAALKEVKRDQVTITTKTQSKDYKGVKADIERFRQEMGTDYIDIVLLHCMMDGDWPEKLKGARDALSEAKDKGHVRAVGCSCHTFDALQAAVDSPWVDVDLARINPFAAIMDVEKRSEVRLVLQTLKKMHDRGKGVYGMKIIGAGTFKGNKIDQSLQFILEQQQFVNGFVIGFSRTEHIDDIIRRMDRVQ